MRRPLRFVPLPLLVVVDRVVHRVVRRGYRISTALSAEILIRKFARTVGGL